MSRRSSRRTPLVRPTLAMLAACLPLTAAHAAAPLPSTPVKAVSYGALPLSFEANQGQTDPQVKFLARGKGYALFLTGNQAVFAFRQPSAQTQDKETALTLRLVNANTQTTPQAQKPLPGTVNYFHGRTAAVTHVPTFAAVAYPGVYPGTDLVYYGSQKQLEYDFRLAPQADPARIKLAFDGAKTVTVARDGGLSVSLPGGSVQWHAPLAYQQQNGQRVPVASRYVVTGKSGQQQVAFAVGAYDHAKPLTIDPVLLYSTYLGGNSPDYGKSIALGPDGSIYVTGYTSSAGFPTTSGAYDTHYNNGNNSPDAFVTKLSADGSSVIYSTFLGGSNADVAQSIVVDPNGEAVVVGSTSSTDFPTTAGAYQTVNKGGKDIFAVKLSADGSSLLYSTYIGGSSDDEPHGLVLDSEGNAYFTGYTASTDFPKTKGTYHGAKDAIVVSLNATGSALNYAYLFGGGGPDLGRGIDIDSSGNAYVTGYTRSNNLFTTTGAFQRTYGGGDWDCFVLKINATGTAIVYATYIGGNNQDAGEDVKVDADGNAFLAIHTHSKDFPVTPGAYQTTIPNGNGDNAVVKLNPTGTAEVYSTYIGGTNFDGLGASDGSGGGLGLDADGNAYEVGYTASVDWPVTPNAAQPNFGGYIDAAVVKFNFDGSQLLYSSYLGGAGDDEVYGIALDANQNAYITGYTISSDYPTTPNAISRTFNASGDDDAFVAILDTTAPTILPIADAFVRDGTYANTNNGATTSLKISSDGVAGSGNNRQAYLKFDVSTLPAVVHQIVLRVWGGVGTSGTDVLAAYSVSNTTWTERGITWNNRPAPDANPLGTVTVAKSLYQDFDVTSYVLAQKAAGQSKVSFNLTTPNASSYTVTLNSREANSHQPVLVID